MANRYDLRDSYGVKVGSLTRKNADTYDIRDTYNTRVGEVRRSTDWSGIFTVGLAGLASAGLALLLLLAFWLIKQLFTSAHARAVTAKIVIGTVVLFAGIGITGAAVFSVQEEFHARQLQWQRVTREIGSVPAADQGIAPDGSPWEDVHLLREMSSGLLIVEAGQPVYVNRKGERIASPGWMQRTAWSVIDALTWKGALRFTSETQELRLVPVEDQGLASQHAFLGIVPLVELSTGRQIVDSGRPVFISAGTGIPLSDVHPVKLAWMRLAVQPLFWIVPGVCLALCVLLVRRIRNAQ